MIHIHDLHGCAPAPLAHYLKALALLRLIGEQRDPDVRGWWEGPVFRLATRLGRDELETFFLVHYEPTPLVSPWNKGSGFFAKVDAGLAPVDASPGARFARFRAGIAAAREMLGQMAAADQRIRDIKAEVKIKGMARSERDALRQSADYKARLADADREFKRLKADLIPRIRGHWRGPHREWMDAAMTLSDEGSPCFPALLGTGGNDGNLDFTNNFMQRLGEIFDLGSSEGAPRAQAALWLRGALWGEPVWGCESGKALGQYLPGMAGGANNANGPDAESLLNPFDFVLTLEGALLMRPHASRKLNASGASYLSAPFAVSGRAAGYASAADGDEGPRGEQWMPLWDQPVSLPELRSLLAEGRAQAGGHAAHEPLDMAAAIATLGAARGVSAFQRFGYIQRNGQSNLAVPLGRFVVPEHATPVLACLDDLAPWLVRLRREARNDRAPASLRALERRLSEALLQATQRPADPHIWQSVLLALADVEAVMATGSGCKAQPVPPLRPGWVRAADDGSAEFRLALACAMQRAPIRRHWLPLDPRRPAHFATTGTALQLRLAQDPAVVMKGRSGADDAIALVERRLVEATARADRHLPLVAAPRAFALPADLAAWLSGTVDADRTLALSRALMPLDWLRWTKQPVSLGGPEQGAQAPDAWIAIRLALLPWPLPDGRDPGADPAIFRRLASGDAATAFELARRRLHAKGIATAVRAAAVAPEVARRWAAAIAFPITPQTAASFARRIAPTTVQESQQ